MAGTVRVRECRPCQMRRHPECVGGTCACPCNYDGDDEVVEESELMGGSDVSTLLSVRFPNGEIDYSWFVRAETFEPLYNWHYPQDGRPPVPEHVLVFAEKLKAEHEGV